MRVADGVERVEGLRIGNAYVVLIDDGLLVVDTGMPGGAKRILAAMARSDASRARSATSS